MASFNRKVKPRMKPEVIDAEERYEHWLRYSQKLVLIHLIMYGRLICVLYLLQTGQHQADCIKPHQAHQKFSPRHSYLLIILSLPSQIGTYGDTGFNSGKCSHFNTG